VGEVGVFYGRYFIFLSLLRSPGERAVAVDIFEPPTVKDTFLRNLQKFGADRDVPVLHGNSADFTSEDLIATVGSRFRILSIDGAHSCEGVLHDLRLARDALAERGVIMIDDYFHEEWPGVSEATNQFFLSGKHGDLAPFVIGANNLGLCHACDASHYQAALRHADLPGALSERQLFGQKVLVYNFRPYRILGLNVSPRWTRSPLWYALKQSDLGDFIRFRLRRF
jgi:hypothetical protein